jgi:transcriptional regulator with XRE-family HTH domain
MIRQFAISGDQFLLMSCPIDRLMSDETLLQEIGKRIARLRLERNLTQAQLAEQAGISKRTLERLEAGGAATQLSLFLRVLRQLDLLERLEKLLPEPQPSPLALLEQQQATRKRASRRRLAKPATSWSWGQP